MLGTFRADLNYQKKSPTVQKEKTQKKKKRLLFLNKIDVFTEIQIPTQRSAHASPLNTYIGKWKRQA